RELGIGPIDASPRTVHRARLNPAGAIAGRAAIAVVETTCVVEAATFLGRVLRRTTSTRAACTGDATRHQLRGELRGDAHPFGLVAHHGFEILCRLLADRGGALRTRL